MTAVANKQYQVAQYLLAKGASVNDQEHKGLAPIHLATDYETFKLLIDAGANVHIRSNEQSTPILFAVRRNCIQSVKLFLSKGANILDKKTLNGTALTLALRQPNHAEMAAFLIPEMLQHEAALIDAAARTAEYRILCQSNESSLIHLFLSYNVHLQAPANVALASCAGHQYRSYHITITQLDHTLINRFIQLHAANSEQFVHRLVRTMHLEKQDPLIEYSTNHTHYFMVPWRHLVETALFQNAASFNVLDVRFVSPPPFYRKRRIIPADICITFQ